MKNINKEIGDIIIFNLSPFKYINDNHQILVYPKFILHKIYNSFYPLMNSIRNSILPLNIMRHHQFLKLRQKSLDAIRKDRMTPILTLQRFESVEFEDEFNYVIESLFKYRHNPYESINSICKKVVG